MPRVFVLWLALGLAALGLAFGVEARILEGKLGPALRKSGPSRFWCRGAESNRRHCDFQSHALPTELPRRGGPDGT